MSYANYLHRTPSTSGNRRTFTISTWFKKSVPSGQGWLLTVDTYPSGNMFQYQLDTAGNIGVQQYSGATNQNSVTTNNLQRDVSAWYHVVLRVDTTQATASDRVRIYINGEEASYSSTTYPSQNFEYAVNNTVQHQINSRLDATSTNGQSTYFAHYHLCDGYSYAPTEFGETDSTSGIWKPKTSPSVSYGTNGFFLKFQDTSNFGDDSSGNTNDLTTVGTITQAVDTPSNVFATLNPLMNPYGGNNSSAFSNGNLSFLNATTDYSGLANLGVINGKWYWEVKSVNQASTRAVGIVRADKISINTTYGFYISDNAVQTDFTASYRGTGLASVKLTGTRTTTDTGVTYGTGDIIGIALDLSSVQKTIKYYKNGSIVNTTNLDDSFVDDFVLPAFRADATQSMDFNFGNGFFGTTAVTSANADANGFGAFEYAVPSGYYALCTKNIKEFG